MTNSFVWSRFTTETAHSVRYGPSLICPASGAVKKKMGHLAAYAGQIVGQNTWDKIIYLCVIFDHACAHSQILCCAAHALEEVPPIPD